MAMDFNDLLKTFESRIAVINKTADEKFDYLLLENDFSFLQSPEQHSDFKQFFDNAEDEKKFNIAKQLIQQFQDQGKSNATTRAANAIGWDPRELSTYLKKDDELNQKQSQEQLFHSPVTQDKINKYYSAPSTANDPTLLKRLQYAINLIKSDVSAGNMDLNSAIRKYAGHANLDLRGLNNYIDNEINTRNESMTTEDDNKKKNTPSKNFTDKDIRRIMTLDLDLAKHEASTIINNSITNPRKLAHMLRQVEQSRDVTNIVHILYNMLLAGEGLSTINSRYQKKYESVKEASLDFDKWNPDS